MKKSIAYDVSLTEISEEDCELLEQLSIETCHIRNGREMRTEMPRLDSHLHGYIMFCSNCNEERVENQQQPMLDYGFSQEFVNNYVKACNDDAILVHFDTF